MWHIPGMMPPDSQQSIEIGCVSVCGLVGTVWMKFVAEAGYMDPHLDSFYWAFHVGREATAGRSG